MTDLLDAGIPDTALQLRSLVTDDGTLRISIEHVEVPTPRDDQVLVRVDAAPINPSDLGLLFAGVDMSTAEFAGAGASSTVTATLSPALQRAMAGRVGQSLPVGNEGGGVVVAAGASTSAQALVGRTVGALGGAMYAQYRCLDVAQCLALPDGVSAVEGAACFVNPLTVLGHVDTMRREGHTALVHTAAASNLGQMLNRLCLADGVALVNVVRSDPQVELLRAAGAEHVCNSTTPTFMEDLVAALVATGATIAFDAVGGGRLASQLLTAMEAAAVASASEYSRYGSDVFKQVYIYGGLDRGPTELTRSFGMTWGLGGWLLMPHLHKIGPEATEAMRQRVAAEITTTFASRYTRHVTLAEALSPDVLHGYAKQATGEKYLLLPNG